MVTSRYRTKHAGAATPAKVWSSDAAANIVSHTIVYQYYLDFHYEMEGSIPQ
jgi:hypothetical protein